MNKKIGDCMICSSRNIILLNLRWKDCKFRYIKCRNCGTLSLQSGQQLNIYNSSYYSFKPLDTQPLKRVLHYIDYFMARTPIIGFFYYSLIKPGHPFRSLRKTPIFSSKKNKVLDIGCGAGHLVNKYLSVGFKNVYGIDPYLSNVSSHLFKSNLENFDVSSYQYVLMNHSFEHLIDPASSILVLHNNMSFDSYLIIRIPIISLLSKFFGDNWVQLDPPYHCYLMTVSGAISFFETAGFQVIDHYCDQFHFGIRGSIKIAIDRLNLNQNLNHFLTFLVYSSPARILFDLISIVMNFLQCGDQVCFVMKKV